MSAVMLRYINLMSMHYLKALSQRHESPVKFVARRCLNDALSPLPDIQTADARSDDDSDTAFANKTNGN